LPAELEEFKNIKIAKPSGIIIYDGFLFIEELKDLPGVSFAIGFNVFFG